MFASPLKLSPSLPLPLALLLPLKFQLPSFAKVFFVFWLSDVFLCHSKFQVLGFFLLSWSTSIAYFDLLVACLLCSHLLYHHHLACLFSLACCMFALFRHHWLACLLLPMCLLPLTCSCPPHLHLLHHHRLACLLPPSCCMSTLFAPISALPPCVTPFAHVLISTCLLHVHLVCTYSTIIAICAYFHLLTSYPYHSRMLHHRHLVCLLLFASLLPPPSTIANNLVLGIKHFLRYLLAYLLTYLLVYLLWTSSLPSCFILSPYLFV